MNQYASMIRNLKSAPVMERLNHLYGNRDGMMVAQSARYIALLKRHEELFNCEDGPVVLISAPGRTEIGGNHTDHNRGKVLAAAVNLDTVAAVSARSDMLVHLHSEGYPAMTLDLSDLQPREEERGTTAALIRGVADRMTQRGYKVGGFDAACTSNVTSGSGLSSSAAFEVLICAVLDKLYNGWTLDYKLRAQISQYAENVHFGKPSGLLSSSAAFEVLICAVLDKLYNGWTLDYKLRAQISQYAENVHFGKPSGLLDQMASSAGGLVHIDFKGDDPVVRPMNYDFSQKGYALVVVNTGGSHADLTDAYAAIPSEMKAVAACFGESCLRRVRPEQIVQELPRLREEVSDRAIMRAMHFFQENTRVVKQVEALESDDLNAFFDAIISSGRSSFMYLQNVYANQEDQSLSLALCLAEDKLKGKGAWRIHGGGFAGTTLNFVPVCELDAFISEMESAFGEHSCQILDIRPEGAAYLEV